MVRRVRRDEDGVAMVFVVVALVALMAVAAMVIDGGRAYATRRQMQNAADASAEGAARALDEARFLSGDPAQVDVVARSVATANSSSTAAGMFSCTVITKTGIALAPCHDTSLVTGWRSPPMLSQAAGVRVQTGTSYETAFAGVVGADTMSARTTAAATIQQVKTGDGPFMACGNPLKGAQSPGGPGNTLLLPDPSKTPPWRLNPAAVGRTYDVHGPQVSDCGAQGDAFKGLADGPFTLPGWIDTTTGVVAGPARSLVAAQNGCTTTVYDECTIIIPVCTDARGTNLEELEMYCVVLGVFTVNQTGANTHTATLLGGATAVGGQTSNNDVTAQDFRMVKLIS